MTNREAFLTALALCLLLTYVPVANSAERFVGASASKPAGNWPEAMVSGNGIMGVMMYGRPYDEIVILNHNKMYLPQGNLEIVHDLAASMPEFKEAGLKAGIDGPAVVHKMMLEKSGQKIIGTDPFHPASILSLKMKTRSDEQSDYRLTENFKTGELAVQWSDAQGDWERKMFVSRPDNVVVMQISGPAGKVGFDLSMGIKHDLIKASIEAKDDLLSAHVVYTKGKGGYDCLIRAVADGGEVTGKDGVLSVSGANGALLLIQVRSWRTPLPKEQSEASVFSAEHPDFGPGYKTNYLPEMKKALGGFSSDYDALLKPHVAVHGEMFSRVKFSLNASRKDRRASSEELLKRAADEDEMPLALMERMYDACRYLIICATGDRPPNLQGIWTGTWSPAWSGDYTLDTNLQLEVQSIMSSGMPELMESYFDLVESWLPDCRVNARKMYGARGIVSNARASNVCLLLHWGNWPGEQLTSCMGWMAHFFYDYYQFTGDKVFLRERVVPLLKEVALFYEDLLAGTEDENGKYRFFISYSPEHRLLANSTFDISVAKAMLTYLIKSCEELSIEKENVVKWKKMLAKMPPYLINEGGDLQEWAWPGATEDYNQRHHSHLLPLYQFCEFDPELTPELWKAAGVAFEKKVQGWFNLEKGSNSSHITHGMMNQGQAASRLGRSDIVYDVLARMATRRYLFPSFMISYWPELKGYGFDPVGTIPDIVNNSLVFAWDGVLDLIPALPAEWPTGFISGVLARGQIRIDKLAWDKPSKTINLTLTSGVAQTITVRLPSASQIISMKTVEGQASVKVLSSRPNCRQLILPAKRAISIEIIFKD